MGFLKGLLRYAEMAEATRGFSLLNAVGDLGVTAAKVGVKEANLALRAGVATGRQSLTKIMEANAAAAEMFKPVKQLAAGLTKAEVSYGYDIAKIKGRFALNTAAEAASSGFKTARAWMNTPSGLATSSIADAFYKGMASSGLKRTVNAGWGAYQYYRFGIR